MCGTYRMVASDARTQILGVWIARINSLIPGLHALGLRILLVVLVGLAERPISRNISRVTSEGLEILHFRILIVIGINL
jgi:hypothetical protein